MYVYIYNISFIILLVWLAPFPVMSHEGWLPDPFNPAWTLQNQNQWMFVKVKNGFPSYKRIDYLRCADWIPRVAPNRSLLWRDSKKRYPPAPNRWSPLPNKQLVCLTHCEPRDPWSLKKSRHQVTKGQLLHFEIPGDSGAVGATRQVLVSARKSRWFHGRTKKPTGF